MTDKVKVLALIWDMGNGGAQQVVINNLRFFKNDEDVDYKVIAFCPPSGSKNDNVVKNEGLNVEYLGYPRSRIRIPVIRYPFNKRVEIKAWERVLRKEKPDVVHVHISELLTTTLWATKKCGIVGRFDTLHSNPYRYKGFALWCIKKAFNKYGFVPLCLNERQAQQAKDHYGIKHYEIVHNGINFAGIKDRIISKKEAREKLGMSDDAFVLAGVGRLDPVKNYELMIDVFKEVAVRRADAKLYIAGGGDSSALKERAKSYCLGDKVVFLGHVNNVTDVYCAADVLLMTSFSEASPLTLVEAQVCGTRCVISAGVPQESVLKPLVSQMAEDSSPKQWAEIVINGGNMVDPVMTEDNYELNACNERIKALYLEYSKR